MDRDQEAGWIEYRRLILAELDRIGKEITAVNSKVDDIRTKDISRLRTDVVLLKFQAAFWGSVGGMVLGSIVTLIFKLLLLK